MFAFFILTCILRGVSAAPWCLHHAHSIVHVGRRSTDSGSNPSCSSEGQMVCSSDGSQFGICNFGKVAFESVADGTACRDGAIVNAASSASPASVQPSMTTTEQGFGPHKSSKTASATLSSIIPLTPSSNATYTPTSSTATSTVSQATRISVPAQSTSTSSTTPSSAAGAPEPSATGNSTAGEDYHVYLGNGDPSEGWPKKSAWAPFEDMWSKNLEYVISTSCSQFGATENSAQENTWLKEAILSEGNSTGVDPRFILAIIMQESNGCVRVDTTVGSVPNPGLMQDHNGTHTCWHATTCPQSEIQGMIQDGVQGTSSGAGLLQLLKQTNSTGVARYYRAARMYNSGSIASNGLLQCGIATNSYSSDVANRVTMSWYRGTRTFPTQNCPESN